MCTVIDLSLATITYLHVGIYLYTLTLECFFYQVHYHINIISKWYKTYQSSFCHCSQMIINKKKLNTHPKRWTLSSTSEALVKNPHYNFCYEVRRKRALYLQHIFVFTDTLSMLCWHNLNTLISQFIYRSIGVQQKDLFSRLVGTAIP